MLNFSTLYIPRCFCGFRRVVDYQHNQVCVCVCVQTNTHQSVKDALFAFSSVGSSDSDL